MHFFEDCNVPKNCEILHFVHWSEAQSQMEVFFDFFSFYYHLGTVSWQITFFKKLNNLSFSTKCYVFLLKIAMYQKIEEILHFVNQSEPQSQMEVFFDFFSFYYHLGTVSWQITFFKKLNNLSFSTKCYVFFEDCNVPKNCEILHFVNRSEPQSQMRSFLRFFLFLLPFRNSIMPNNIFSKNSIIWVFQRNVTFFLKIAMYQKIAKFSTWSTGSEAQSQMKVFFDFFSFYYHLGTVSWQITWYFKKTQ